MNVQASSVRAGEPPQGSIASTPLRVLWVGAFLPVSSGSRSASEDVGLRLAAHGYEPQFVSRHRSRTLRVLDIVATIVARRHPVKLAHVDIYSGPALRWAELATGLLVRRGARVIATLHGGGLAALAGQQPQRLAVLLSKFAAVVAPSPWLARELAGVSPNIQVIPNGLDLAAGLAFPPTEHITGPQISWIRAFDPTYRPELAVEVVAQLVRAGADARIEMTGPDKGAKASTGQLVRELGLLDRVSLRDAVAKDQVPGRIAAGEVFLSTSAVDNTPVTVLEAMACGRPVVAVEVGGLADVIESEREGLLVGPEPAAIATAIQRLQANPELVRRLTTAARVRVAAFDWNVVVPQWAELFGAVART